MEFKASHRYARMGVRKARLVMDLVRGRTVNQALDTLAHDRHRASRYVRKVLASAVANALQNPDVRSSRLIVKEAFANEGPLLQGRMRFRPSAMGRALPFRRRTCHIHFLIEDPEVDAAVAEPSEATEATTETPAATPAVTPGETAEETAEAPADDGSDARAEESTKDAAPGKAQEKAAKKPKKDEE